LQILTDTFPTRYTSNALNTKPDIPDTNPKYTPQPSTPIKHAGSNFKTTLEQDSGRGYWEYWKKIIGKSRRLDSFNLRQMYSLTLDRCIVEDEGMKRKIY
jgi:hypothetical protein